MEDMERYGDYNEIDTPPGRGGKLLVLKIIAGLVCLSVVGLLIFRIVMANYYPDFAKEIYFDSTLVAYYNERGGDIGALTQNIRSEYDDPDEGNIFCDHLIVIRGAGQLQIAVKFNKSVEENITKKLGFSPDTLSGTAFTFRLVRDNPAAEKADEFDPRCVLGTLSVKKFDTGMQYGYYKLAFNGVDFDGEAFGGAAPSWIRLETFIDDGTGECRSGNAFTHNLIYENHEAYNAFDAYELSDKEAPGN